MGKSSCACASNSAKTSSCSNTSPNSGHDAATTSTPNADMPDGSVWAAAANDDANADARANANADANADASGTSFAMFNRCMPATNASNASTMCNNRNIWTQMRV